MVSAAVTAPRALPAGRQRFAGALRAEWTKVRSVRSTLWCLVATVVGGIGICVLATSSEASNWRNAGFVDKALFDPTSISLTGLLFGQLAVGVLGVLVMSAEYGTGTIRASLAAVPRRPVVLGAKIVVFGAVALVVSEVVAFAAFFIGQAILSGSTPTATLSGPGVTRAVVGGGLYLTVLGLLALGLATIIRHTAGAIFTFVSVLLILPLIVSAFPASIGHPIGRYLPAVIGSAMTTTTGHGHPDFLPSFPPWTGFSILCAYAVGALVVGGVIMVRRDP
ncbi:MAG TPA: ABC transporter permease [Acidimicrobiales bacterium]|nr:ABC transporter permease [Acidimicrobiales bacterium]